MSIKLGRVDSWHARHQRAQRKARVKDFVGWLLVVLFIIVWIVVVAYLLTSVGAL